MSLDTTLPEILARRAREQRDRVTLRFTSSGKPPCELTYGELAETAQAVADRLQARGVEPGDRVMIMLPTGPEFAHTFYGALLAAAIPVPVPLPMSGRRLPIYLYTLQKILQNMAPRVGLIPGEFVYLKDRSPSAIREFIDRSTTYPELMTGPSSSRAGVAASPDSVALIQYSSGSTGAPKGICLSHTNLTANIRAIAEALGLGENDRAVAWLPLFHDMGLIGVMLGALVGGWKGIMMPPIDFIRRPLSWLKLMSRERASISPAPQLAYSLILNRVDSEKLRGIDLSCVRTMLVGAEPLVAEDLRRFSEKLAPTGLRPEALVPCYGLAENSLAVSFERHSPELVTLDISARAMAEFGRTEPPCSEDDRVVACSSGFPLSNTRVRIVDQNGKPLADGQVGDIQIRGTSTCSGYFRRPDLTRELFNDDWLRTGDLGFIRDGRLFVSGRRKEVIIIAGRNYYPADLEEAVSKIQGIQAGKIVAVGRPDAERGTEGVVLLAEVEKGDQGVRGPDRILREARSVIASRFGVTIGAMALVPRGHIPITASGKLGRSAVRQAYLDGTLQTSWCSQASAVGERLDVDTSGSLVVPSERLRRIPSGDTQEPGAPALCGPKSA